MATKIFKPILLLDITQKKFSTVKEFEKIIENFPSGAVALVTFEQKKLIYGFPGNNIRFIDGSGSPLYLSKDLLVFDSVGPSVIIATGRDLDTAGETYRENEFDKVQTYVSMGIQAAVEYLEKNKK